MPITINDCKRCGGPVCVDNGEVFFELWCTCGKDLHRMASKMNASAYVSDRDAMRAIELWNQLNPIADGKDFDEIGGTPV